MSGGPKKTVVIGFTGPLSGPAAEYGQDCYTGIDLAIQEIDAAGGITVKGQKAVFKLEKLDDRIDPTQAVNNARRLRDRYKSPAVFNPVFNTLAALTQVNQEKGNEFLIMAYTSTPKVVQMKNKLLAAIPPPFTVYVQSFGNMAWEQGWRKAAMVATLGAYGEEWRHAFKAYWEKKGGTVTTDKPANYYTETDFSAPLTAALATKPDLPGHRRAFGHYRPGHRTGPGHGLQGRLPLHRPGQDGLHRQHPQGRQADGKPDRCGRRPAFRPRPP